MKNTSKNLLYALGGMFVLGILGVSALSQGSLLQGNLSLNHGSAPQSRAVVMNTLTPTHQIRKGEMPFLKFSLTGVPEVKIDKMKMNLHAYDLNIANLRFMRNGKDITELLTQESQSLLSQGFQAEGKSIIKMVPLVFDSPLSMEKDQDIYLLQGTTYFTSKNSTLRSSVIDAVVDNKGWKSVIKGPAEITNLEVTYVSQDLNR